MIRGALIFAAGLTLGYSKGVSEAPAVKEFLDELREAWTKADRPTEENTPYCPYCGAAEEADGHGKSHADDCPIVLNKTQSTETPEGETPSE